MKQDSKTFSSNYRKAAYACFLGQVPVEKTSSVIQEVVEEITGFPLDCKASVTTIAQFAYEVGVLSDIQVFEAVVESQSGLTIGWDATSLSAEHIDEVHLMFPGDSPCGLELQVSPLAGGTTQDYVGHITEALSDIRDSYALVYEKNPVHIKNTVVSKLKNTISDWVAVNHCVRQTLEEVLGIQLLELKCNLHPLDGIANTATLKKIDSERGIKGECHGKSSSANNLIYGISKVRYKQGTGDPKSVKTFLKEERVKSNMIVRYVGNRLRVIFHLAGVFSLCSKLIKYIK